MPNNAFPGIGWITLSRTREASPAWAVPANSTRLYSSSKGYFSLRTLSYNAAFYAGGGHEEAQVFGGADVVGEGCAHLRQDFRVFGRVGQVVQFARVFLEVEQHFGRDGR